MPPEDQRNLLISGLSETFALDGYSFKIEIYRPEDETEWTLEVIDQHGTSHIWDMKFATDKEALKAAAAELVAEGPIAFMRSDNIIQFRK